jgi:alkylhydroperoxidase family enzyme
VSDRSARIAPRPRDTWDAPVRAALDHAFPADVADRFWQATAESGTVPVAIATMLHHPELTGPWLEFNNVLLWNGDLGHRCRELVVLRVAWRTRSNYEWTQHVRLAGQLGLTSEEIDAVATHGAAGAWTEAEAALLAATDELLDDHRVSDDTWARLAAHFDERARLEFVFVVGAYSCLAMVFNACRLPLEADARSTAAGLPD